MIGNNMGDPNLAAVFIRSFSKFGFDTNEESGIVNFNSKALKGSVTLTKPFTITWKTKDGYEVIDLPLSNGKSSAQFKKVSELLSFMTRYILHKNI